MLEQISEDIKSAMRAREKLKLEALRMLKSKLLENKSAKSPVAECDVAISYCKKLKDSLVLFPKDSEQYAKVVNEMSFLSPYLPQPLDRASVEDLIRTISNEQDQPNLGSIMKVLSPQIKGRFDGREATDLIKTILKG